jgi:hypothetical protein
MNQKLLSLAVIAIAFAMVFSLGVRSNALAQQIPVGRDLGAFHQWDANQFGDDRAYSSSLGTDRDADAQAYIGPPMIHGHGGNDWYYGSAGS